MGMRVGYARVSSSGQKLDLQMDRLSDCDRIYHEKASAASAKGRPELQKALDFVRDEDVFVVTKLDRLARSVVDLAGIVQKLEAKKVDLVVLDQGIDTTTMYGRLQFNILAAIGEFERELIKERSMEGRIKAIARGVKFGAKPKLTKQEIADLIRDFEEPGCSKTEIAEHYGISNGELIKERSMEGRIKAIARGVKFGAKPKLTKQEIADLIRDFEEPGCSKTEIAEHYGISRSSVYRLYAENRS